MAKKTSERRRFSRVTYHQALTLKSLADGSTFRGGFSDISLNGMLFVGEEVPEPDSEVEGVLTLGDIKIQIHGKVLRVSSDRGIAIQFINMDVESFSHLRRLVALNMGDSEMIDREFFSSL